MIKHILVAFFTLLSVTVCYSKCDSNATQLINAYPQHLLTCQDNYIIWKDGFKQLYDDGIDKNFQQLMQSPDIQDMFTFRYRTDEESYTNPPQLNNDAGRIRNTEFFRHMYGNTQKEVEEYLTTIAWLPNSSKKTVLISSVNDIDKKLKRISASLDALPKHLKKYVIKHAGSFNWRYISGTKRLSAHSFAIAIDINTRYANYWKWNKHYRYDNQIPKAIVKIFEDNGFIWGGKWYHYDTMHFEYRPELLGAE